MNRKHAYWLILSLLAVILVSPATGWAEAPSNQGTERAADAQQGTHTLKLGPADPGNATVAPFTHTEPLPGFEDSLSPAAEETCSGTVDCSEASCTCSGSLECCVVGCVITFEVAC